MNDNIIDEQSYIKPLRARFAAAKLSSRTDLISDAEMFSLMLSYCDVQVGADIMTERLCECFGSLEKSFFASADELMRVRGMTEQTVVLMKIIAAIASEEDDGERVYVTPDDFRELFLETSSQSGSEEIWVASFDDFGHLYDMQKIIVGFDNAIDMHMGLLLEFASQSKSGFLVLGHCHPSSEDAQMSDSDRYAMEYIGETVKRLGTSLRGQVIVAGSEAVFYPYPLIR